MSNTHLIIPERSRDIGDFLVGRLLPFRKKRMVGPFVFMDHMGPSTIGPGRYMDVGQHPHIGLSTLTYLFEGNIVHRDSLGSEQLVTPGSVGWMTAGSGIVHTERTPQAWRDGQERQVHGYQIWVALPKHLEGMDPEWSYTEAAELPSWTENSIDFTLVAGKGYGKESPVPVHSDLFMVDVQSTAQSHLDIGDNLKGEIGICVVSGYVEACGERMEAGNMLVSKEEDACSLTVGENTHLLLFGGEPFAEERFIEWNFVATSKAVIATQKKRWIEQQFDMVPGESGYIKWPGT